MSHSRSLELSSFDKTARVMSRCRPGLLATPCHMMSPVIKYEEAGGARFSAVCCPIQPNLV